MVDFGSGEGLSDFETGGARRKCPWGTRRSVFIRPSAIHAVCWGSDKNLQRRRSGFLRRHQNLKPEKSVTADVTISLFKNKIFQLDNTFYYTRLYDVIVTDSFTYNNQSTIVYEGVSSKIQANQILFFSSLSL